MEEEVILILSQLGELRNSKAYPFQIVWRFIVKQNT